MRNKQDIEIRRMEYRRESGSKLRSGSRTGSRSMSGSRLRSGSRTGSRSGSQSRSGVVVIV